MYLFIIYCCKSITQTHGIDGGNNTGDLRRSTFRWNTRYIWFENRKICNKLWVWYWYCALLCEFDIVRCCVRLILCVVTNGAGFRELMLCCINSSQLLNVSKHVCSFEVVSNASMRDEDVSCRKLLPSCIYKEQRRFRGVRQRGDLK